MPNGHTVAHSSRERGRWCVFCGVIVLEIRKVNYYSPSSVFSRDPPACGPAPRARECLLLLLMLLLLLDGRVVAL